MAHLKIPITILNLLRFLLSWALASFLVARNNLLSTYSLVLLSQHSDSCDVEPLI